MTDDSTVVYPTQPNMNPFVGIQDIEAILGRVLTDRERYIAQMDLNAIIATLEGWLRRKLTETSIIDEPHLMAVEGQRLLTKWGPVKEVTRIKYTLRTDTWIDEPSALEHWHRFRFPRDSKVWVSYVTDATAAMDYEDALKRIMLNTVVASLSKPDRVKYGVLSNYSVEGTSITYGTSGVVGASDGDKEGSGMNTFVDLLPIIPLRRRVIA